MARTREVHVHCDYETSNRAGAGGTFQVISITEGERDITSLVDIGFHWHGMEELKKHLERLTGDEFLLEEV